MQESKYEARYLLTLLSAVLNDKKVPVSVRHLDWEHIFKLADYHNVANVAHYGVLGLSGTIGDIWKNRFFEKYQESVIRLERIDITIEVLRWQLEKSKIHAVFLNEPLIGHYYMHREMYYVDKIEVLVEPRKKRHISSLMESMDYKRKEDRKNFGLLFQKVTGVPVVFYEELDLPDAKGSSYYKYLKHRLILSQGCRYIHEFDFDEYYVYLMNRTVTSYACGDIDIRQMMDLWVYYTYYQEEFDWAYINKMLGKMEIKEFADRLIVLTGIWFEGLNHDEIDIYEALEAYVLTKGLEGIRVSAKLITLSKEVARFYEVDKRKQSIKEQWKWMFPKREYMETIYPCLRKVPCLIVCCWFARLVRALIHSLKRISRKKEKE